MWMTAFFTLTQSTKTPGTCCCIAPPHPTPASGGTKRYLLSTLAGSASLHTEWFWAFTFAFAVSSSYLNADNFASVKEVVTKCLQQFAGYLAGVGIPGMPAQQRVLPVECCLLHPDPCILGLPP
jgi:hypothetical protein